MTTKPNTNKMSKENKLRLVRRIADLPAPKFLVRMTYRGMAKDCDRLATRLASFGQTQEASQAYAWATAYRTAADGI